MTRNDYVDLAVYAALCLGCFALQLSFLWDVSGSHML